MVQIFGRTGASFITVGYIPDDVRRNVNELGWSHYWFYPDRVGGSDPNVHYIHWEWRRLAGWRSSGATTTLSDRALIRRWIHAGAHSGSYVGQVRGRAYGPGGIRAGASSHGGALQRISRELYDLTLELNRRGLWPYPPPGVPSNLPGDPEASLAP